MTSLTTTLEPPTAQEGSEAPAQQARTADAGGLNLRIFSSTVCTYCNQAKRVFRSKGVPFEEINVELDTEPRDEFNGLTPRDYVIENYGKQMPVIIVTELDTGYEDSWVGSRPDKIIETVKRFTEADLLIPEDERL